MRLLRTFLSAVFILSLSSGCASSLSNFPDFGLSRHFQSEDPSADTSPEATRAEPAAKTPEQPAAEPVSANAGTRSNIPPAAAATGVDKPSPVPPPVSDLEPTLDEALDFCQAAQDFWQKGELDNALEALDQAYALILTINTEDDPKLIQQKEDLRFLISKRILEIYASRHIVVAGNHKAIPIVLNEHVNAEIKLFTTGRERKFFIESFRRSGKYRKMIVAALKEAGLPTELSWLPLIESGFKERALSRARALGLWQFIPSTGYKFGLKRDTYIDERLDPVKSTMAAIAYLKELHQIFGDWTTVLAAYNCGEGRVLRVIRSQNVNYLDNFWDLYRRLPYETARYVPRFIATLHVVNNLEKYGFDPNYLEPPVRYETITVNRKVQLKKIAAAVGVSESRLRNLNPELRYRILPPKSYKLKVPEGLGETVLAKVATIPEASSPQGDFFYHRVRRGESLSTIARKYRTSIRRIKSVNRIPRNNLIVAGKLLKIPRSGAAIASSAGSATSRPKVRHASSHKVKRGDSLWIIANRYGTTVNAIKSANNLSGSHLTIGQVLKIPGPGKAVAKAGGGRHTYQVKRGDSPYKIAQRHNMALERFLRINRLTPRTRIYPGQKLFVE